MDLGLLCVPTASQVWRASHWLAAAWGGRTGREAWLPKTQSFWVQSERPAATKGWICGDHHRKGRGGSVIL